MAFTRAKREQAKARILLEGPAGCGKSMGALLLAKGIGGKIAAIDTERGSLSLYSHVVPFDVQELRPPFTPERFVQMIHEAEAAKYDILILDGITPEWSGIGGLLEEHDKMPGNSWANWAKITPRHQKFIDAILQSPCHIIATVRTKAVYTEGEKNGKKTIEKTGTEPQQRDGLDFEFTLVLDLHQSNNTARSSKDRTELWKDRYAVLTPEHGVEIREWLSRGDMATAPAAPATQPAPKAEKLKADPPKPPTPPEPTKPAATNPATAPATTGAAMASAIKAARQAAIDTGHKNRTEVFSVASQVCNREVGDWTQCNIEELNRIAARFHELAKEATA